jgi:hypothetical protein
MLLSFALIANPWSTLSIEIILASIYKGIFFAPDGTEIPYVSLPHKTQLVSIISYNLQYASPKHKLFAPFQHLARETETTYSKTGRGPYI